jgi:hypothetical protein
MRAQPGAPFASDDAFIQGLEGCWGTGHGSILGYPGRSSQWHYAVLFEDCGSSGLDPSRGGSRKLRGDLKKLFSV